VAKSLRGDRLAVLRRRVDVLDRRIVRLLGARQRLVAAMKPYKKRVRDPGREASILRAIRRQADCVDADRAFVSAVFQALLAASRSFLRRR
jgi:chorismate mutase